MNHADSLSYLEVKRDILSCYYRFCAERAVRLSWTHSEVLASVYEAFEGAYEKESEQIMCEVAMSILAGSWTPDAAMHSRQTLTGLVEGKVTAEIAHTLSKEDAEDFLRDLETVMMQEL